MRYFKEIVSNKSDDIIAKWINFFVLYKSIIFEKVMTATLQATVHSQL